MSFEDALNRAKEEKKLVHHILLWGALDDQSCWGIIFNLIQCFTKNFFVVIQLNTLRQRFLNVRCLMIACISVRLSDWPLWFVWFGYAVPAPPPRIPSPPSPRLNGVCFMLCEKKIERQVTCYTNHPFFCLRELMLVDDKQRKLARFDKSYSMLERVQWFVWIGSHLSIKARP